MRGKTEGIWERWRENTVTFYATALTKRGKIRLKEVEGGLTGLGYEVRGNLRRTGKVRE